ncbi:unknown protein [Seminavis robusta]|uniref:Methyltransferase domain-containing protein n=1 Tax=Seminavis robusta TaxID=568900 RepID=A0A9N8HGI1_9STRA|nr:unknown protein [Seminavis robusta]|eukprot:Sro510_g157200.1 n/a (543) ;mRNA; r:15506-17134
MATASTTGTGSVKEIGRIVRKKKFQRHVSLAIRNDGAVSVPVLVDRESSCLPWCCLGAWIEVEGVPSKDGKHIMAAQVTLIQCAPDPNAVLLCLKLMTINDDDQQQLPLHVLSCKTQLQSLDQVTEILQASRDVQRREIAQLVRQLNGLDAKRIACQRKPHTRQRHLKLLERIEGAVPLMEIVVKNDDVKNNDEGTNSTVDPHEVVVVELPIINLPQNNDHNDSHHDDVPSTERLEYLRQKKWPQIQWILQRLSHQMGGDFRHVLDVGGGRGDLAVAIARAFPTAHVTVVDQNEPSLEAGREYARQLGLSVATSSSKEGEEEATMGQMRFHCANFASFVEEYHHQVHQENQPENQNNNNNRPIDVVVALHACGDLSDLALQFAHRIQAKFTICPCCYTKRYIGQYEPLWMQHYKHCFQQSTGVVPQETPCEPNNKDNLPVAGGCNDSLDDEPQQKNKEYNPSSDEQIAVVQRLAELNESPEVSHRAMHVINSLRLQSLFSQKDCNDDTTDDQRSRKSHSQVSVELQEYHSKISMRNIVLVGK